MHSFRFRLALDTDFDRIFEIWQDGLKYSFDIAPHSISRADFRNYFNKRNGVFNYWVAEVDSQILGWLSLNRISEHPLKKNTFAEMSLYFDTKIKAPHASIELQNFVLNYISEHSQIKYLISFIAENNKPVYRYAKVTNWDIIGKFPVHENQAKDVRKIIIAKAVI